MTFLSSRHDQPFKKKNGAFLVVFILSLCTVGASLTFWSYTQHVFSTNQAHRVNASNMIEAVFQKSVLNKIQPHHHARVTIDRQIFDAEVVSVTDAEQKTKVILRVGGKDNSQLPYCRDRDDVYEISGLKETSQGSCEVTIDTTIPRSTESFSE